MAAPRVFYRVEDADSGAYFIDEQGILAADTDTVVYFGDKGPTLLDMFEEHLDWSNRYPTPFISTYSNEDVAWREAHRRIRQGKDEVKVYKIDTRETRERVEYRNVRKLARSLGFRIQDNAWNNSEYEWIFLHRIPYDAVVGERALDR